MTEAALKKTSKFIDDFKNFAVKGNAFDLAVGVIIGASFGRVISSMVADVIMPPLALLTGKVNLNNKFLTLSGGTFDTLEAAKAAGAVTWNYGTFFNVCFDFLLTSFAVFAIVRVLAKLKAKPVPPPVDSRDCPRCLSVVKKAATRCAFCTTDLEPVKA